MQAASSCSPAESSRTRTFTSRCTRAGRKGGRTGSNRRRAPPGQHSTAERRPSSRSRSWTSTSRQQEFDANDCGRPPAADLRPAIVCRLRISSRPHRHAVGRDDGLDRRCSRGRHDDLQVLHHRPDDHPVRDPARQRLGANAAGGMRSARRDGDGARRGRRSDQVHGGEAPPRGTAQLEQCAPRAHERGEELAVRTVAASPRTRARPLYFAHVCGEEALDAIAARRRPASRSTARCCTTACASRSMTTPARRREYHIGMGLRPREDCEALWRGLADGRLRRSRPTSTRPRSG